jgi:hypothetical protein
MCKDEIYKWHCRFYIAKRWVLSSHHQPRYVQQLERKFNIEENVQMIMLLT